MRLKTRVWCAEALAILWLGVLVCSATAAEMRLGFFPNITHAQALYARATGYFDKQLDAPVHWVAFNDGPTAIEALFANEIDAAFIGPGPTINGYWKSHGEKFVIIAGAATGGTAMVVRSDAPIHSDKDFNGKTIATPQLGNTQDIAARVWFKNHDYRPSAAGGTVNLMALSNPDQLTFFKEKQIDGAWTVEPWVSRLEIEAGGRLFLDEKDLWPKGEYVTTHLIVSRSYLRKHPQELLQLLRAHVEVTQIISTNKTAVAAILNKQIRKETSKALRDDVIQRALLHVNLTWDPAAASLYKDADEAYEIHFLRRRPDLSGIYDLTLLNQVLTEKGLPPVSAAAPK